MGLWALTWSSLTGAEEDGDIWKVGQAQFLKMKSLLEIWSKGQRPLLQSHAESLSSQRAGSYRFLQSMECSEQGRPVWPRSCACLTACRTTAPGQPTEPPHCRCPPGPLLPHSLPCRPHPPPEWHPWDSSPSPPSASPLETSGHWSPN